MAKHAALSLTPRLIGRFEAAAYISVSPTKFDEMVKEGRMPCARRLSERRIAWDVRELDAAVDDLPSDGPSSDDRTWEHEDA